MRVESGTFTSPSPHSKSAQLDVGILPTARVARTLGRQIAIHMRIWQKGGARFDACTYAVRISKGGSANATGW